MKVVFQHQGKAMLPAFLHHEYVDVQQLVVLGKDISLFDGNPTVREIWLLC